MNKEFCCRCGIELGYYDGWRVTAVDRRRGSPLNTEASGVICDECAAPALAVVREAKSGDLRHYRFAEAADA